MKSKIKTAWDLKLLYKTDTDPQIEKDLQFIEKTCEEFEKKYRGSNFTATPESLAAALAGYNDFGEKVGNSKPWWYFALKIRLDSRDSKIKAFATKYEQRITVAKNRVTFFTLEIGKIPAEKRVAFVAAPAMKPFAYVLTRIFNQSKHNLTEQEEQLDGLLSQTSYGMWVEAQDKLLNEQTIKHKGKTLTIEEALARLSDMSKADRPEVAKKIGIVLKSISFLAEAEINAVYNYKKVMDTRRGYANPYSAMILSNENNEQAIENFVALVTKNFTISKRFFKLHAKLLGQKKIHYADRSSKIGKINATFDFKTSVGMLRSVLERFEPEFAKNLDRFLENGQVDVYPKKGKEGGAFHWSMGKIPAFVFLNHTDDIRSLETFAHEMGHATHGEQSKAQPYLYEGYSIATAEVASTFFEQLISDEIETKLSEKEKIVRLHNRITADIATVFRQIACFNFELELHKKIRADGQVSAPDIAKLMSKHLQSYLGDSVVMGENDGYSFVYWSHIRRFFYVYTYAYGQLISRALYEKWKQDPSYAEKIKQFLRAGCSMSPEDIFKSIGIDTSSNEFFEAGLRGIEKDIERLEEMTKRAKR